MECLASLLGERVGLAEDVKVFEAGFADEQGRELGENVEELRDCVGLAAHHCDHHRDGAEHSEGLAVSCSQGDVRVDQHRAGNPQFPRSKPTHRTVHPVLSF